MSKHILFPILTGLILLVKLDAQVKLPSQKAGGPHEFQLLASNQIKIEDIYFGDVWICSGQSNMELTMERAKYKGKTAIEASNGMLPSMQKTKASIIKKRNGVSRI